MTEPNANGRFDEDAGLTPSQRARRDRMLNAALELALEGGWDAVQMREVAQRAEVALGTLYRYFSSKEYLLVSVMISEIETLATRLSVKPAVGSTAVERVVNVLSRANRALQRQPQTTIAMIRALVSANTDIAPAVIETRSLMRGIISEAVRPTPPANGDVTPRQPSTTSHTVDELIVIDLLSDIWLACLVSWISGVSPVEELADRLTDATRILIGSLPEAA